MRARNPLYIMAKPPPDVQAAIMDGTTPEPHVTINDRGDRLNAQKMPPIGWMVDKIILMESIVGKTAHVEQGRWKLGGDVC